MHQIDFEKVKREIVKTITNQLFKAKLKRGLYKLRLPSVGSSFKQDHGDI